MMCFRCCYPAREMGNCLICRVGRVGALRAICFMKNGTPVAAQKKP